MMEFIALSGVSTVQQPWQALGCSVVYLTVVDPSDHCAPIARHVYPD
jgi:hypothetical protein